MMIVCEYLIGVFSFFFILYANSALLKTRKKEFGLLALFGMTRWQLRRLIFYENAAMAAVSAGVGIGLGILFSKLFFMALSVLLGTKAAIRFHVPPEAVWLTASGFMLLFMAITALSLVRIGRTEIAGLLKEARMPKPEPVFPDGSLRSRRSVSVADTGSRSQPTSIPSGCSSFPSRDW
ncbi:ABC transporter permease [Paenibacillus cisolokensis]|nr:ABC transporter permease [Paenibacillus cisolokensis]